ncbi:MAG: DUF2177 family protein [Kiritimatiellae bacterium]|nr:DUF2177 family protein [Kiritimatiellia bacterium]
MGISLRIYLACIPIVLILDGLWLGVIARNFYQKHLGYLFAEQFVWGAAAAFYMLHAAGVVYFAVLPSLSEASLPKLILSAALFGLFTYGTYDLTNWATIRDWPAIVVAVDILWGITISTVIGLVGYAVGLHCTST